MWASHPDMPDPSPSWQADAELRMRAFEYVDGWLVKNMDEKLELAEKVFQFLRKPSGPLAPAPAAT